MTIRYLEVEKNEDAHTVLVEFEVKIPPNWLKRVNARSHYVFDPKTSVQVYLEGVKRWGVDWLSSASDSEVDARVSRVVQVKYDR